MIELKKADIESIAQYRYSWARRRWFFGGIVVALAVLVVVGLLVPSESSLWLKLAAFLPVFAGLIYGMYRYLRSQDQAIKDFVLQCEADPVLEYRPEPED